MGLDIKSVLVVDGVGANCQEILNSHGINVVTKAKITKQELLEEIPVSSYSIKYCDTYLVLKKIYKRNSTG